LGILIRENKVTIKIDFDEIMFNANRAVYVGLLFNELIINSLKHAFTPANSNRQITVLLKIINHQLVFNYSDNGIGIQLPVELKLITILTNQLKNKFIIEEKTGFNFSIKLT
jgi:two-component sensor histidine kinase